MDLAELSIEEAVRLGAVDGPLYASFFFPRTVRQAPASFDREVWDALDFPEWRYIAMKIFRGGAKTARLRLFTSRRIAYGVSHSIVYTSNSEGHAVRSVSWLKRQIMYNRLWTETFGLRQGAKWSENEIEIIHGVEEFPIKVVAVGITGQVRGFLSDDDFRPDLIVGDDVDNEETTGTPEQRIKAQNLFFGALGKSLAPPTEAPLAKMALAQTPLAEGDTVDVCSKDPSWHTLTFGCFNAEGESTWEARFTTAFLRQEKENHIRRNQLSMWMREMECKLVSTEQAAFRFSWLKPFDVLPEFCWFAMFIDPAFSDPDRATANDNDYMAMGLLAFKGKQVFLDEYVLIRGRELDYAMSEMFRLIFKHRPRYIAVETVAFQKILAHIIRVKMQEQRIYIPVREVVDKRRKSDRITQDLGDVAARGDFHYRPSQQEFLEQYTVYHAGYKGHDDLLDGISLGIHTQNYYAGDDDGETYEGESVRLRDEERMIPALSAYRGAP
jgi:hypothetical protein